MIYKLPTASQTLSSIEVASKGFKVPPVKMPNGQCEYIKALECDKKEENVMIIGEDTTSADIKKFVAEQKGDK